MTDDKRETVLRVLAVAYLVCEEGGDLDPATAEKFLGETRHFGDCMGMASTCPVCYADEARAIAKTQWEALEAGVVRHVFRKVVEKIGVELIEGRGS